MIRKVVHVINTKYARFKCYIHPDFRADGTMKFALQDGDKFINLDIQVQTLPDGHQIIRERILQGD